MPWSCHCVVYSLGIWSDQFSIHDKNTSHFLFLFRQLNKHGCANEKWRRFAMLLGYMGFYPSPRLGLEEKLRIELYNRSGGVQSGVMWSVFCLPVVERKYLQLYWFTSLFQLTVFQVTPSPSFSQLKWWFVYCKHHWSSCAIVTHACPSWWSLPVPSALALSLSLSILLVLSLRTLPRLLALWA